MPVVDIERLPAFLNDLAPSSGLTALTGESGRRSATRVAGPTRGSATALGITPFVGSVRAGFVADLLVLDGDPTADMGLLGRVGAIPLVLHLGQAVGGSMTTGSLNRPGEPAGLAR